MAYLRYSRECDWYVFEQPDGRLAIWHKEHRAKAQAFTQAEATAMIESNSFDRVAGFEQKHTEQLSGALKSWLSEVEMNGG